MERNFLDTIIAEKKREVADQQATEPLELLRSRALTVPAARRFSASLRAAEFPAIIAEIKRASPSKGAIRPDLDPFATAAEYASAGAACISVLTDEKFFQGNLRFLESIRTQLPNTPLLRKDFIIDPYQVWQSRAAGADALLLIVAALSDEQLGLLTQESKAAGLEILMEVHTEAELERAARVAALLDTPETTMMLGVNNRDLQTFAIDMKTTGRLAAVRKRLPALRDLLLVAESGIKIGADINVLADQGADAFLVGESLVATGQPGPNLSRLIMEAWR